MDKLKLQEIKGPYDVIIGLGSWCGPALHLRRHNLRRFSFPFDWVLSYSLTDAIRLLENRFKDFMEMKNMCLKDGYGNYINDGVKNSPNSGGSEIVKTYIIEDTYYNIISVHDFTIIPNQDWTEQYPAYKEKLTSRINKFLEVIAASQSVLFVRFGPVTENEAVELQSVLKGMISGKFNILFLQPIYGLAAINEIDWGIDGICTVQVPPEKFQDPTINANSDWDYMLNGLSLTNFWI